MALKRWILPAAALLALAGPAVHARATDTLKAKVKMGRIDTRLHGRLIDCTRNHGADRRIWSRALHQKRDLYVYLPPGYDCNQLYPVMIYLHGFAQDEQSFLHVVPLIDEAIACGKLPPLIVAAPDGSLDGECCCERPGSFWINSGAGSFEDFVLEDVWDYLIHHFSISPQREAHILAGVSMGGFGAFNLGIRHREGFGIVMGIFPPLNLRWMDCSGDRTAKFEPRNWGWRPGFDNTNEVVARVGAGCVRLGQLIGPVFGSGDAATAEIMANNPIELVDRTRLCNGELAMFIAYAGRDEFNIDAQVESFLYLCKHRGLGVTVVCDINGHHDAATARRFVPAALEWLAQQLTPACPCPGAPSSPRPQTLP
jgi:S-formylglutathione hydrolase FrmB